MNKQRNAVYSVRNQILENPDQKEYVLGIADDMVREFVETHCAKAIHPDEWDIQGLRTNLLSQFGMDLRAEGVETARLNHNELIETLTDRLHKIGRAHV